MAKMKSILDERRKGRREFLKKSGIISSGLAIGVPAISGRVQADNIGGGGSASIEITSEQDASSVQFPVTASCEASHVESTELTDGSMSRYQHVYKFDSTFTATDGSGNKTTTIGTHQFRWDASDASANVDCYTDKQSPYLGCSPDPGSGASEPTQIYQDIIEATASAASTEAGVVISTTEIIQEIVNHVTSFDDSDPDIKQWLWEYGNTNHQDVVNHQLDPDFRHDTSTSPTWVTQSVAEGFGNEITFYGGQYVTTEGNATSISSSSTLGTTSVDSTDGSNTASGSEVKISRTPGLEPEDFHDLHSTVDMTKNERKKYGVRDPTEEEKELYGSEDEEVVSIIERFPMSLVARGVQK